MPLIQSTSVNKFGSPIQPALHVWQWYAARASQMISDNNFGSSLRSVEFSKDYYFALSTGRYTS